MDPLIPIGIVAVLLLHFLMGKYPDPRPLSKDRKRAILETLAVWAAAFIVVNIFMFSLSPSDLADPGPRLLRNRILVGMPFELAVPLLYLVLVKKWTAKDLGFSKPRAPAVMVFALCFFLIGALVPLFLNPSFEPLPVWLVLISLYQPAFIEEFFFRAAVQGNLEKALGPTKAWIFAGILFGLFHIGVDFFGPYWTGSLLTAVLLLVKQIIFGWIYGIIYAKTRSLLPSMVSHYIVDGRLASIIALIFLRG